MLLIEQGRDPFLERVGAEIEKLGFSLVRADTSGPLEDAARAAQAVCRDSRAAVAQGRRSVDGGCDVRAIAAAPGGRRREPGRSGSRSDRAADRRAVAHEPARRELHEPKRPSRSTGAAQHRLRSPPCSRRYGTRNAEHARYRRAARGRRALQPGRRNGRGRARPVAAALLRRALGTRAGSEHADRRRARSAVSRARRSCTRISAASRSSCALTRPASPFFATAGAGFSLLYVEVRCRRAASRCSRAPATS